MNHWDAEAIILSGADSRDDKIIRMLLETDELVPAIVKYARKPGKSSKSERIQPLGRVHVMLRGKPSDELAYLENIAVESPHAFIKGDLLRFGLATTMAEIVLHLVPDWGQEPGIYTLLAKAMAHLDDPKARAGEEILALFELRTLDLAGVLPPLDSLAELPLNVREALEAWRQGAWKALSPQEVRAACRVLEQMLASASGRPLVSRAFLDQVAGL